MDRRDESLAPSVTTPADAGPDGTGDGVQMAVNQYFERTSQFWDELYRGNDVDAAIYRLRLSTTLHWIDELDLPPGARVLELGCGAGLAAVALAQRGCNVRATDPVAAMLARARANAATAGVSDRVAFGVADAQALEFADQSMDLVLALGVLPWIADPPRALQEMARVTKSGGTVIVSADNADRLHSSIDPRLSPYLASTRIMVKRLLRRSPVGSSARSRLHSIREVDAMLEEAGLDRLRGQSLGFGPFTLLGRRVLPDHLGVRLHRSLQRREDHGDRGLTGRGAQYLVLARKGSTGRAAG